MTSVRLRAADPGQAEAAAGGPGSAAGHITLVAAALCTTAELASGATARGRDPTEAMTGDGVNDAPAVSVAWLGSVACQIGTAFAVRMDQASLPSSPPRAAGAARGTPRHDRPP